MSNLAYRFTNDFFKPADGFDRKSQEEYTEEFFEEGTEEQSEKQINQGKLAKEWWRERLYVAASYCKYSKSLDGLNWYNNQSKSLKKPLKYITFEEFEFIYTSFDNINEKFANSSYCVYGKKMLHEYILEKGVDDVKNWIKKTYIDKKVFTKDIRQEIKELFQNPYYFMTFDCFNIEKFSWLASNKDENEKKKLNPFYGRHRKRIDMIRISDYCQQLGFDYSEVVKDMNRSYEYNLAKWGSKIASGFRQMRFNQEEVPACDRQKSDKQKAKEAARLESIREEYRKNHTLTTKDRMWLNSRGMKVSDLT